MAALEILSLRRCVQLSDGAVEALAGGCAGLRELSLNKVVAISDAALVALAKHCAKNLEALDLSWCRDVTDSALGALVDAAPRLRTLSVWGCSQLTREFYAGHTCPNAALELLGRPPHFGQ